MKQSLLLLLLLPVMMVHAQDYGNICLPGVTTFRSAESYNNLKAFRYDSLRLPGNGDSVFISFPCLRYLPALNIYDTAAGGILGHRIVKQPDGRLLFFNRSGDTIRINATAGISQGWKMISLPGGGSLTAMVDTVVAATILGMSDSVKVILLQAYDSLGNPAAHVFNGLSFRVAKYSGLVTLYDLWTFPNDTVAWTLAGMTSGNRGLQPLRMREVFDFNVGDEFQHKRYVKHSVDIGPYTVNKSIRHILGRSFTPDSSMVTYSIANCFRSVYTSFHPADSVIMEETDTISESYDFGTLEQGYYFERLPGEFFCTRSSGGLRYANDYTRAISYCAGTDRRSNQVKVDYYVCGPGTGYQWQAYAAMIQQNRYLVRNFGEGLGQTGVFNSMISPQDDSVSVFTGKGTATCGTRLAADCSSLLGSGPETRLHEKVLRVIPNPVVTLARIIPAGLPAPVSVTLVVRDALGRTVSRKQFPWDAILFDRAGLADGIYFLTLADETGMVLGSAKAIVAGK